MTVSGETEVGGGVAGEREKSDDEVVDGGDKQDLGGILMGFAKVDEYECDDGGEYECDGGEGERDRSLLLSLLLSSASMMKRSRILVSACW